MPTEEQILRLLSYTGPSVGSQLAAKINEDSLLTSAFLADLVRRGKIKISKFKTASSPFYYLDGQEEMLIQLTIKEMNHKDRPTIVKLQENGILRDDQMTLLERVSIRKYPDLALPMQVTIEGAPLLYWRWFQVEPEEFTQVIEKRYNPPVKQVEPEVEETEIEQTEPEVEETVEEVLEETEPEVKDTVETEVEETEPVEIQQPIKPELVVKKTVKKDEKLLPAAIIHLEQAGCTVQRHDAVKKNREHNFKVLIPTHFGDVPYFVKIRHKKKCDEKDLSAAYMEAEVQRLPLLFLYTGTLNDKAQAIAESDRFESLLTGKIEWD